MASSELNDGHVWTSYALLPLQYVERFRFRFLSFSRLLD